MKYAIINANVLDSEKMTYLNNYKVLVEDEKIKKITKEELDLSNYQVIDLQNKYLLPGLVNLHVHLPSSGKPKNKASDPIKTVKIMTSNPLFRWIVLKLCASFAKTELLSGCTTIRTVGGVLDVDSKIRDKINEGKCVGPRILASNMAISVEGGHMAHSLAYAAKDEEDAVRLVNEIAKDNPDCIKLMITGGVLDAKVKGEPGVLKMKPSIVKAACDEAHKLGFKVAAHVESTEGVKVAIENGVDTIEHGAFPTDEIIELFKSHHSVQVATISPALPFALFDREISHCNEMEQYNGNLIFEGIIECAKKCLDNNIPVGLGTDTGCPFITHYDFWRELNYFKKYVGVSKEFAFYTATLGNAKIAEIDKETGSIEEGKFADMIVCSKDPLKDLTYLRKLDMVIYKGHIHNNPKIKKMKVCEEELDKFL